MSSQAVFNGSQSHAETCRHPIRLNLRSYDPIVRGGGDEFVGGFAATDAKAAGRRAAASQAALAEAEPQAAVSAVIAELRRTRQEERC